MSDIKATKDFHAMIVRLDQRRVRLELECDMAHKEWKDCYDEYGRPVIVDGNIAHQYFEAWTAAIENLNETVQAIALLHKIADKVERKLD